MSRRTLLRGVSERNGKDDDRDGDNSEYNGLLQESFVLHERSWLCLAMSWEVAWQIVVSWTRKFFPSTRYLPGNLSRLGPFRRIGRLHLHFSTTSCHGVHGCLQVLTCMCFCSGDICIFICVCISYCSYCIYTFTYRYMCMSMSVQMFLFASIYMHIKAHPRLYEDIHV